MKFSRVDDWHARSDCGRYIINKAIVRDLLVYQAVRLGKPWSQRHGETQPRGWDGSVPLHVERDIDPNDEPARIQAIAACRTACEGDANV